MKQSTTRLINLVNQRQEFATRFVTNFIDTDGRNPFERPVFQAPFNNPLDATVHLTPGCTENRGHFGIAQASRPVRQKLHQFNRHIRFAIAPRNFFRNDFMDRTGDSSHSVQKKDGNVINRDKFKTARLFVGVISRTFAVTFWANSSTPFPGNDDHVDSRGVLAVFKHDFFENEGLVIGDKIEYLLQDISVRWERECVF